MLAADHFWQSVEVILEDVPVIETNFLMLNYQFKDYNLSVFQNDGSPTLVTRLKVAPNMVDSISLNEKRP